VVVQGGIERPLECPFEDCLTSADERPRQRHRASSIHTDLSVSSIVRTETTDPDERFPGRTPSLSA
jgi:hypothetical protein